MVASSAHPGQRAPLRPADHQPWQSRSHPRYDANREPSAHLLLEAKGSVRRNDIRMAIGQLLDYQRLMGEPVTLAVLLPEYPAVDIVVLLHSLRITVIWPSSDRFQERSSEDPRP